LPALNASASQNVQEKVISLFPSIKIKLTPTRLILLVAAFFILTANFSFFDRVTDVYPLNTENLGFLISLVFFFYGFIALLTLLLSALLSVRLATSLLIILAAVSSYYADSLGVVIDSSMIRNVMETNLNEALDLINPSLLLRLFLLGIIPVILVWRVPLQTAGFRRELRYKLQTAAALVVLMVLSLLPLSDHYSSFFREHKPVRYYSIPSFPIYSMGKYIKQKIKSANIPQFITLANSVEHSANDKERELVILVVGETVRSDHFSLNGYARNTNPRLAMEKQLISYSDISACGTSTAISVPCMFAFAGREDFDPDAAEHTENILDVLQRAGVNILWRDNNSDSKGVASRITYQDYKSPALNTDCDIECRDTGMLVGLQDYIDSHDGDILIVLHQMGSHGPAYYKRYPHEFEHFKPACHSAELSTCTIEEITNAYDNSILYTDYFLAKVIELLKQNNKKHETTMFYVSDHGESLGEAGLYLHGLPFMFAPDAQTKVPVLTWVGSNSDIDYEKTLALKNQPNSHDALFPTLLKIFEVTTDLPHPHEQPLIYLKDKDENNTD